MRKKMLYKKNPEITYSKLSKMGVSHDMMMGALCVLFFNLFAFVFSIFVTKKDLFILNLTNIS